MMNEMKERLVQSLKIITLTLGIGSCFTSCVKDPDEENRYPITGETIAAFLENRPEEFSSFTYILKHADLDRLLTSYGQYTCFAPTNDALAAYIDSLYHDNTNNQLPRNGMADKGENYTATLEDLTDSLCLDIAQYHLSNELYSTIDMSDGINIKTMLSRMVLASVDDQGQTVLNDVAVITSKDNLVTNGYVHAINKVIPRSNRLIGDELKIHPEYSIFYEALEATGLTGILVKTEKDPNSLGTAQEETNFWVPKTCKIGYTVFAEPNDVFERRGINSFSDLADYANDVYSNCADRSGGWYDYLRQSLQENGGEVSTGNDYENPLNTLNIFMRYHVLDASIPRQQLVRDYKYTHDLGSECYDYYQTMLEKTLIKVWQVGSTLYLNRYQTNNTLTNEVKGFGDIHVVEKQGITLGSTSSLQPLNGYIHPINDILLYDADVPTKVLNERMRFDCTTLVPEMMTNGLRWMSRNQATNEAGKTANRARFKSNYFENICIYNETTNMSYNFYDTGDYLLYQGDVLQGNGVYDMAIKLPPVPAGTYELRICYTYVDHGSMMQYYLGTSSEISDMQAIDIPLDLRLNFVTTPSIRWTWPEEEADLGVASDEALRARGFMRGPLTYERFNGPVNARTGQSGNDYNLVMRRILTKQHFDQRDYWLRVKSVLPDNTSGIFQLDYVEFAPASVTDNTQYKEDMF